MLNLHRLHLLRELSLRGTVAEVAQALAYSPSTISQQLSTLETEVDATLLEPVGRRLRLTLAGEILVEHAGLILQAVEEAQASLSAARADVSGTVRLACFQTAALVVLPTVVAQLRADHPQLLIQVREFAPDQMIAALQAHDFDLVMGEEYPGLAVERHPSVEITEIASDRLCVVGGPLEVQAGESLQQLADVEWVMEPPGNAARHWAVNSCRQAGFEPRIAFESADLLVHVRLAEVGLAAAFLPDLVWLERPRTLPRWQAGPAERRRIFVANRPGAAGDPAIAVVRTALAEAVTRAVALVDDPAGILQSS